MSRRITVGIGLAFCLSFPALAAIGTVVEGEDRALIRPPRGVRFAPYSNDGYRLRLRDGLVEVEVRTKPLETSSPFRLPARRGGEIEAIARATTSAVETRFQAVSRILSWVNRNLRYELDRSLSQSAEAVLERRSGYCTGLARLTVAMLDSIAIPSREVAGYVISTPEEEGGFHRWVEVYYPDRGWVFSDPLRSHHFVPATYLRLAGPEVVETELDEGVIVHRENRALPVDLYPGVKEGVRARRNRSQRLAGALQVKVEGAPGGEAILEGSRGRRWSAELGPDGSAFLGLEPGEYTLRLLFSGQPDRVQNLRLNGRVLNTIFLSAN